MERAPLRIGPLEVWPPVVLAPMAGITNPPFRRICRRFGAGLYVSEMITARGLIEGNDRTWERAAFDPDESPRSIQLYGTDPRVVAEAVRRLAGEGRIDHVDLNLGCPARKVTRHGGGAALCLRLRLLADVLAAAVAAAGPVPVTAKFRIGVDADHPTHLEVGRLAEDVGIAAVALHGRTAAQLYSGTADWTAIAELTAAVRTIPVLGNGDIWTAADALAMVEATGCDGVVIGRGCLGNPWLFRDLAAAFDGRPVPDPPLLGEVLAVLREHVGLIVERIGEDRGVRLFRKHTGWYLTGYPVGPAARRDLAQADTLAEIDAVIARLDPAIALPDAARGMPRGTTRGPQQVSLPDRWLALADDPTPPGVLADTLVSGG